MLFRKINLIPIVLLALNANAQQVVKATDVNIVTTPGTRLVVNGGVTFTGTSTLRDSGKIFLLKNTIGGRENWSDSTAAGVYTTNSNGQVIFASDSLQYIYGNTKFYDMRMNNDSGAYLNSNIEVRNQLDLDTGNVTTIPLTTTLWASNPATTSIASTSNFGRSRVNGSLKRAANVTSPFYLFPIGKDSLYAPIKLTKFNTAQSNYTAEYFEGIPYQNTNVLNPPIDHISSVEWWEITSDGTLNDDDAKVSLSWRGYSRVSSNATVRDSLLVAQYILTNRWEVPGGWVTGNTVGADSLFGYVTSSTFINSFTFAERRFTLGTTSKLNILPITLVSFTAAADANKVRLNWDIRNDMDVTIYEVEKSLDGAHFSYLNTVSSMQRPQWMYTSFDNNPTIGWNYYRLKIIDKQGHFTYSPIRSVKFSAGLQEIKIFPNPVINILNVQLPTSYSKVTLQLFASDGKLVSTMQPVTNYIQLNVTNLASGTYIIQILKTDGSKESYRFIKF
jgi:hypothetical protein